MIAVLRADTSPYRRGDLVAWLKGRGLDVQIFEGRTHTVIEIIGDTAQLDIELLQSFDIVESAMRINEAYRLANRRLHPQDTVVSVGGHKIGGGNFQIIAGPCSVESKEQIAGVAQAVQAGGAALLRGGAFKPRTSPYDFQGLKADGIEYLLEAKRLTGMPVVTEIMRVDHLPLFEEVDVIQVGARNMQNYELLKALGKTDKVILLKRGLASTLRELLMSAEYIMAGGNDKIILCERGIRTYETSTRSTLDLSAVPMLHEMTHLPVIVDPSHATGKARLVAPMAMAAAAAGADGLMIEVHDDPMCALCDGAQALTPGQFSDLARRVARIREAALR